MRKPIAATVVGFVATALLATSTGVATAATSAPITTAISTATSTCSAIDAPKAMNDLPASADCNLPTPVTGGRRSNAVSPQVTPVTPTTKIGATPLPFDRTNGDILAITKVDGTNEIAFGGNFSLVYTPDGVSHAASSFAVVDETTGAVLYAGTPTNTTTPADIYVRSITSMNGAMYIGGDFTGWGGVARAHAVALSPSFAVTAWNPAPTATVRGIAVDSNGVYLGGDSTTVRGVNLTTGATLWSKTVTGGSVHAMLVDQGAVFVGGLFETYDSYTQHGLVKVSPTTGSVITAFNGKMRADDGIGQYGAYDGEDVIALALGPNNGQVLAGVGGHAPAGLSSNEIILMNISTGARAWKYSTIGDSQAVGAVGDTSVSGYHNNGADQNNPLSVNHFGIQVENSNGVPTTWDPLINGDQTNADGGNNGVQAMYVDAANNILFLAGAFEHWNGTTGLTHASLIAFSYTPSTATAPGAPSGVAAVAGNANATVSWAAPVSDGGSPITGYTVTAAPGGLTATTTGATSTLVSGLTNGTSYTFTVKATNVVGTGPASTASAAVTPTGGGGLSNSAEGGTAATSVTVANSGGGSGSALTVVSKGAGAALVYSTAAAAHGSLGYALTGSSGTGTDMGWNGFSATSMAVRFYYNPGLTLPSTPLRLADIRNASGTAARVMLSATNQLFIQNTAGATLTTFAHGLQANTWYRVELAISVSASTATVNAAYYPADSTTPVDPTFTTTAGNTGTANLTQVLIGSAASATWTGTGFFDDLAAQPASVAFIGPYTNVATVPGAPTAVTATAGNASATVSWTAPVSNGGSAITGYTVTSSPGGLTASTGGATSTTVLGLTNGTQYTFTVVATNSVGPSVASAPSNAVTPVAPATVPGAPTGATATAGDSSAGVSWTAPVSNGGSAITGYTVTSSPGGLTGTSVGAATTATVSGLTNGTPYTFTVVATNSVGPSAPSAPTNQVTPAAAVTVPGAPTAATATASDSSAGVSWTAPVSNGGSPITGYTVTSSPGGLIGTSVGAATTATVSGLTNGTPYTFTVVATNSVGPSAPSAPSNQVTPVPAPTVPGAPTAATATAGDTTASVSWTAPASNGGSAITGYTVMSSPGGLIGTSVGAATTATVSGLTNGTPYTFTVVATNSVGPSAPSAPSNQVTPAAPTAPGAPTAATATAGDANASVTWTAPASDGGSPITGYTVTSSPGGLIGTSVGAATSATVSGLTNGTPYTFTVVATNSVGPSAPSAPSNQVTPAAPTAPGAPTGATATAGDSSAGVSWTPPASTGGSPITGYTVTSSPGGLTGNSVGAATTATVNGLTNGTQYTFTVVASNSVGPGPASDPSNQVTPAAVVTAPGAPTGATATAGDANASVSWTAPGSNGGSPITGYTVTSSPGGLTGNSVGAATTATVNGLTNGTQYTFTVVATNSVGPGPASDPSNQVTPAAAVTPPGAPTAVLAAAGNGNATVSWSAPGSNGGSAITGYTVTSSPGGLTASTGGTTSTTVLGLTNGTQYTFTVVASNSVGPGPASAPSNAVTPAAPAGALANTAEGGTAGTSVTAANSGGGSGNAFTVVSKGAGAALVYSTSAMHGSRGYALTGASGTSTLMGWNALSATSMAVRFYYNTGSTLPNSLLRLADIRNASGTAARIELSATNQLFIQNTAGSTVTTFAHPLQANTWYRIELTISVSASGATINAAYYLGDSTTPVDPAYATSTGNTGTANITQVSIGSAASATWVGTSMFDDLAIQSGSSTFIGPSSP